MKINLLKKVGVIGYGNMGSAIAQSIAGQGGEYEVFVFDKEKVKLTGLKGIKAALSSADLADKVDTIILAVKPQDFDHLLKELRNRTADKLIVSIAAGISTQHIEKILTAARVVRAMPNIGAKVAESVTCLCKGASATDDDLDLAQELFSNLGAVRSIPEEMMNAATAISGSGPAYVFYFIENSALDPQNVPEHARHDMMRRLEHAAEILGFSEEDAAFLAANTANAAISLLHKTKLPPQELRKQVTSKGGTTEAAIEILAKGGSWEEAAQAALKRAADLARRS